MATQVLRLCDEWQISITSVRWEPSKTKKKQSNQKQWSFKGHKTLSDDYSHDLDWWSPHHFSCNQRRPRNMLAIQSTNKRVPGWTWLFPMVHVWHLGGGVLRRGGRTVGHTWEWVGAKRDEGGEEGRAERDGPFSDKHRVFLQTVSKLIFTHFPLAPSIFPKH